MYVYMYVYIKSASWRMVAVVNWSKTTHCAANNGVKLARPTQNQGKNEPKMASVIFWLYLLCLLPSADRYDNIHILYMMTSQV